MKYILYGNYTILISLNRIIDKNVIIYVMFTKKPRRKNMPYDGIVTSATVWELSGLLTGGRIEKIYQTEKDEIVLLTHSMGERLRLLISASPVYARMHLTRSKKENPAMPPPFCMVLRKHIQGGRIANISQSGYDRIVTITIETNDEMGFLVNKHLIVEIMGKHSNIILTNNSGVILDSIKHVDERISSVREILPARPYVLPPQQDKLSPADNDTISKLFESTKDNIQRIDKFLLNSISGFSPFLATSICNYANVEPTVKVSNLLSVDIENLKEILYEVVKDIKENKYSPAIVNGEKPDFHVLRVAHFENMNVFQTVNLMLDEFFTIKDSDDRLTQKKASCLKNINNAIERNKKKLLIHEDTLREAADYDKYRIYGELLYANMYSLKEGEFAEVYNYYEETPNIIKIELIPDLGIKTNANIYFNKYKKLKSSYQNAEIHINETKDEIYYLENVKTHLENSTDITVIEEIKEELAEQGYAKSNISRKKGVKQVKATPIKIISTEGYEIYIGKNNKQNDELTLKIANANDLWLHVKNAPGSHVIVRTGAKNGQITQKVIEEAASYAAFYSSERESTNVTVDFTRVKHVKKPSGAKPGMVHYTNYKSISVKPNSNFQS